MAQDNIYYATGKRKNAIAKTWITPGNGEITINGRTIEDYFRVYTAKTIISQPLQLTNTLLPPGQLALPTGTPTIIGGATATASRTPTFPVVLLEAVNALEKGQVAKATRLIAFADAAAIALEDGPTSESFVFWSAIVRFFEGEEGE